VKAPGQPAAGSDMVLWALNWGESVETFNFLIAHPSLAYRLKSICILQASSLLHGGFDEPGAPEFPRLTDPLQIECAQTQAGLPQGRVWEDKTDLSFSSNPNSWAAILLESLVIDPEPRVP